MAELSLSANMEDYLEAILELEDQDKVARVKAIAERLQVKMPSVSGALKALKSHQLVQHEAYGYVTLTPQGRQLAQQVRERHHAIVDFLTSILHLPPEQAETEACDLEHALSPEGLQRLLSLTGFFHEHPGVYQEWLEHVPAEAARRESAVPAAMQAPPAPRAELTALDKISPGTTVRVHKVGGSGAVRRRLVDMGLRPGIELRVARLAPLGDPVEVHIMDYHLTLRKEEAAGIQVQIVAMPLTQVPEGDTVVLQEALGRGLMHQLRGEGLAVGQPLTVTQRLGGGAVVVQTGGREVTIGRGRAQRLIVRPGATDAP